MKIMRLAPREMLASPADDKRNAQQRKQASLWFRNGGDSNVINDDIHMRATIWRYVRECQRGIRDSWRQVEGELFRDESFGTIVKCRS